MSLIENIQVNYNKISVNLSKLQVWRNFSDLDLLVYVGGLEWLVTKTIISHVKSNICAGIYLSRSPNFIF